MGTDNSVTLHLGDCLDVLAAMEPDSVDTCITDPPYGLEFMGKEWDKLTRNCMEPQSEADQSYNEQHDKSELCRRMRDRPDIGGSLRFSDGMQLWHHRWAKAVLRVLKPGAMLLAFGGTRTHHRLMCAIEDAGFEIRDVVMWVYGSGFPKSHDISKAIDKAAGAEREKLGVYAERGINQSVHGKADPNHPDYDGTTIGVGKRYITAPATDAAALWDGYGTALKPAYEPIILAMKPRDGTFANNALVHGVAGLWIDGARVPTNGDESNARKDKANKRGDTRNVKNCPLPQGVTPWNGTQGRWPANLILDEEAGRLLDEMSGETSYTGPRKNNNVAYGTGSALGFQVKNHGQEHHDRGGASRFFYCPKASRSERNAGLEGMEERQKYAQDGRGNSHEVFAHGGDEEWQKKNPYHPQQNHHPTVKPVALLEYLCRLTKTPTGGVVLDPFMGSGSTGIACVNEGRSFIGIEIDPEYMEIAKRRIEHARGQVRQLELMP